MMNDDGKSEQVMNDKRDSEEMLNDDDEQVMTVSR